MFQIYMKNEDFQIHDTFAQTYLRLLIILINRIDHGLSNDIQYIL